MEYTKLGKTDIEVSKLCVGCMSFGKAGTMHDWTLDESATEAVVRHAQRLFCGHQRRISGKSAEKERFPRQGSHRVEGVFQSGQTVP